MGVLDGSGLGSEHVEAYAIHDQFGSIVSLAFVEADAKLTIRPLARAGCAVTRVTLPTTINPKNASAVETLIRQYRVDAESGRLTKRKATSGKRR
jgi:hypothetical protein